MSKWSKILLSVFAVYVGLVCLHVKMNIGWAGLGLTGWGDSKPSFRVGFLPVT